MYTIEQVSRHHSTDDVVFHTIVAASAVDWEKAYEENDTAELAGDAVRDMILDATPEPFQQLVSLGLEGADWDEVFEVLFEIQEMTA